MWQLLLKDVTAILQNAPKIYFQIRQAYYYKMQQF